MSKGILSSLGEEFKSVLEHLSGKKFEDIKESDLPWIMSKMEREIEERKFVSDKEATFEGLRLATMDGVLFEPLGPEAYETLDKFPEGAESLSHPYERIMADRFRSFMPQYLEKIPKGVVEVGAILSDRPAVAVMLAHIVSRDLTDVKGNLEQLILQHSSYKSLIEALKIIWDQQKVKTLEERERLNTDNYMDTPGFWKI